MIEDNDPLIPGQSPESEPPSSSPFIDSYIGWDAKRNAQPDDLAPEVGADDLSPHERAAQRTQRSVLGRKEGSATGAMEWGADAVMKALKPDPPTAEEIRKREDEARYKEIGLGPRDDPWSSDPNDSTPWELAAKRNQKRHGDWTVSEKGKEGLPIAELAEDFLVPKKPSDFALYAIPPVLRAGAKGAKAVATGLGAAGFAADPARAEAGPLSGLRSVASKARGLLGESANKGVDDFLDWNKSVVNDIQMKTTPMAANNASSEGRAAAKDYANSQRESRWGAVKTDEILESQFTKAEREAMWNAADEESVALQLGRPTDGIGLSTLDPRQRVVVDSLQEKAKRLWVEATEVGLVRGNGLPSYTPRMFMNAADEEKRSGTIGTIGKNLSLHSANLLRRKHLTAEETEAAGKSILGQDAELARDIRVLPIAMEKMERAIAGRTLINNIKKLGDDVGEETVSIGVKPRSEGPHHWFTIDHPSAHVSKERVLDDGSSVWEKVPIYVRSDFEGPLRSVLSGEEGKMYRGLMALKAKAMSVIMYSPLIHNAVEYGRALPTMPGKVASFKIYFEGNKAKNDPAIMREAVQNGLVPIGNRGGRQDISDMLEEPRLSAGRSWTSQALAHTVGRLPQRGMTKEQVMEGVKTSVDKAGDFWHNTLLWDRVADLQMGLYVNYKNGMLKQGMDEQSASRAAAHLANRYAGAIPNESMSEKARKAANLSMFSRSFTLGNIGAMKDMLVGLPKDVQAQILRDVGPEGLGKAKSYAQKKAIAAVTLDVALMYAGNSILQDAVDRLRGDKSLDEIGQGYVDRLGALLKKTKEHPLEVIAHPFESIESLSSTHDNEPKKKDRILVGYQGDGTAIYARNPVGKIGEEFLGWATSPFDMVKRKLSTVAKPMWQVISNDAGFGQKVYNPNPKTTADNIKNIGNIVSLFMEAQVPADQIRAARDLYLGDGDKTTNTAKIVGPFAGVSFSKGAPGGTAAGELYSMEESQRYKVGKELPDIRKQILRGDEDGAMERMLGLGISPELAKYYLRTTLEPQTRVTGRKVKDMYRHATPEDAEKVINPRRQMQRGSNF